MKELPVIEHQLWLTLVEDEALVQSSVKSRQIGLLHVLAANNKRGSWSKDGHSKGRLPILRRSMQNQERKSGARAKPISVKLQPLCHCGQATCRLLQLGQTHFQDLSHGCLAPLFQLPAQRKSRQCGSGCLEHGPATTPQ